MLKIQQTRNYSQFQYYQRNRLINDKTVNKALVKSIQEKNMLESHPILVNDTFHVIDGQNRLEAAKLLNLPIWYIVSPGLEDYDIPRLQIQKNWESKDYLRYYQGYKEDYAFVSMITEKYGYSQHLPFVIRHCSSSSSATVLFRQGTFKITKNKNSLEKYFKYVADVRDKIKILFPNFYMSSEGLKAMWSIVSDKNYSHSHMLNKIEKYAENAIFSFNFKKKPAIYESLRDRVYNHFSKKAERIGDEI